MPAKVKVTPRRFPPPWSVEERGLNRPATSGLAIS